MNKRFITEDQMIEDGFRLGLQIYESGFEPTFIVGLWRGGAAVGIVVQECLQTLGVRTDHIAIRTSYSGMDEYQPDTQREIRVHGTGYVLERLNRDDRLLIVDDVCSSGRSVQEVIARLRQGTRRNMPVDVRVATCWVRPHPEAAVRPDYFVNESSDWLVFPYELKGLSREEIAVEKSFVLPLLGDLP